jgi:hypothetical protein
MGRSVGLRRNAPLAQRARRLSDIVRSTQAEVDERHGASGIDDVRGVHRTPPLEALRWRL